MKRALLLALVAVAGCNPSQVRQGDPLYGYVGSWYYLAMPLSGPHFRNTNMFGQKPFLDAGTKVRVTSVDRVAKSVHVDWNVTQEEMRALEPVESQRVYRIYFDGPEACRPRACEANWRLQDDAAFEKRFRRIFVRDDPLARLPPDRLELVKAHKVASWMSPADVVCSIGEPNFVVSSFGRDHWVYEERVCDAGMRLLAIPKLELTFEGERLAGHQALSRLDFYVLLEPSGQAGVCYDPLLDNGPIWVGLGPGGNPNPDTWNGDAYVWDQFYKLPLSEQLRQLHKLQYPHEPNNQ